MHASILFWVGCWNLASPVDKFKPPSETTGTDSSVPQTDGLFVAAPPAATLATPPAAPSGGRLRRRRQATTFTIHLYRDGACTQPMGSKAIDALKRCTFTGQGRAAIGDVVCTRDRVQFTIWKSKDCKGPGQY